MSRSPSSLPVCETLLLNRPMSLTAGARLGPYEIVGLLGEGGMGEVYRALDPRIGREVAIKVLPASFAEHPDRLRRFEQEARAAGSLNHPNLLTIFELGVREEAPYIVSELLEGQTLREMLRDIQAQKGSSSPGTSLPLRKIVDYGAQIAAGLAAAHEKGIVHRDLKPENIFITPDGRAKILDFGLAKLTTTPAEGSTNAETAQRHTDPGSVLGTMGYMSPEQVRGQNVDGRSDIFALGAILYEMSTGARAFRGHTSADTMSAILTADPLEETGSSVSFSPGLRRIIEHCLEKSPDQRFQSAHDLAFDIASLSSLFHTGETKMATGTGRRSRAPLFVAAALIAGIALGAAAVFFGRTIETHEPPRFSLLTHSGRDADPAASPDGQTIAFSSLRERPAPGTRFATALGRIWVKQLNGGGEAAVTSGPLDTSPRFSPDGATILFLRSEGSSLNLYRVPVFGGGERKIREGVISADWSPDGKEIVFTSVLRDEQSAASVISIISSTGVAEREVARMEGVVLTTVRWSPDGKRLAVASSRVTGTTSGGILLVDIASGNIERFDEPLSRGYAVSPAWSPSGQLVWSNQESNFSHSARFLTHDFDSRETRTLFWSLGPSSVVDVLAPSRIVFGMSDRRQNLRGVSLVAGGEAEPPRWLTRGSGIDRQPSYSPDGSSIIFSSTRSGDLDLWQLSVTTGEVRRLTDDGANDWDPAFTPDGKSILWSSDRSGNYEIWMADDDGSRARQVSRDGIDAENPTMTVDGNWIVYSSAGESRQGIWKIRPDGSDETRMAGGSFTLPEVSPDGRWVSYTVPSATATGQATIRVIAIDDAREVFEIDIESDFPANNLGRHRWLPDGSGIAFWSADEDGNFGVFVQDFVPGRDTSVSRRKLGGFDNDFQAESFGIAPDGSAMTVSVTADEYSIAMADGITW